MKTPSSPKSRVYVLKDEAPIHGYDAWVVGVQDELNSLKPKPAATLKADHATVEVRPSDHGLWLVGRWNGAYLTMLPAFSPMGRLKLTECDVKDGEGRLVAETEIGTFNVELSTPEPDKALLRVRTTYTPISNIRFPFWPRDLCPVDAEGNPMNTRGVVHATQRSTNSGIIYSTLTLPVEATFFYFHNLTWNNGYAQTTETELKGVIGDSWPDLGYRPPVSEEYAMTAGEEEEWSDFFVRFCEVVPQTEGERARTFLDALAEVYRHIPPPETEYRDWPRRAEETLKSLESPKVWVTVDKQKYLRPYVNAEHPDSMVQSILIPPLERYEQRTGKHVSLIRVLRKPIGSFYDEKSQAYRRWLASAAPDHDPEAMDSWYLYHPLTNLACLAKGGDEEAKDLLKLGASYGVKIARHFQYNWPIQFNLLSLEATQTHRKPGEPGESDVPGLFAYVMLECHEIFGDDWYLEEAQRALQQLKGLGFDIGYQFNNVAWGAVACARLWRITGDDFYLDISHCFIASFFHNCVIWEPDYGLTRAYSSFMAVKCLHDADYTAMFEEYESFVAFHQYLTVCGEDVHPSVLLLTTEYIKFLLSRGWYYYPSELPEEILSKEVRNGEIDRELAIPLEDLYQERHLAGAVGQETYGSAAAFDFVSHAYHQLDHIPFLLFAEYPLVRRKSRTKGTASFFVRGDSRMKCRLRLIPFDGAPFPPVKAYAGAGRKSTLKLHPTADGALEFFVKGGSDVTIEWGPGAVSRDS